MTLSGSDMHRLLMDGYKDIQFRIERLREEASAVDSQRGDLAEDRSDALVNLAEHYLPELTRDAIENSWGEVRDQLNQILMRKEDQRRRSTAALADLTQRRQAQEERLGELDASLTEAGKTQDERAARVEAELAADQRFAELSRQAAAAEVALERAEENLNEIEQDAARKLPSYEESTLFTYLRDRKYGTEQYRHRGFTRRMDRMLAGYIGYHKAKKGYDFLTRTPEQMRKIIADDRAALDTVMEELETRRDRVIGRVGLTAAVQRVEQLSRQRESHLDALDQIRDETGRIERQLTDLDDTRGEYYGEAVDVFRKLLERLQSNELVARAEQTASPTDDQIVARIQGAESRLDAIDDETRKHQQRINDLQHCLDAAGRLMQRFRAAKFDGSRSHFLPTVDVPEEMRRATSEHDIEDLWHRLRRAQRWGPVPADTSSDAASNPIADVLMGAMGQAAGALAEQAHRAGKRRHELHRYRGDRRRS